ncbi:BZ3500_MvSof-1268-A1-R1_Chr1-3g01751 [Microbotryum saponariae]|uniref:BZ3500_MvSof-1268-A1-R1_Chr1-3g01751 protein n=1 Tax=Microbotryum saponariae TaxID=289078 RepID=A0A2X0M7J2_9BASI|nr:BZ3500_MvSof-1268-A1-R1_Chr1-3g01751 [Microbotryum saponariae]SCZ94529.1 BZ3501_MvSof-1269-A2-R1_Chr1-3g01353 [Microbotryum saponariae]
MPSTMLKGDNGLLPLAKGLACQRCKARKTRVWLVFVLSAQFKHLPTDNIACVYNEDPASQPASSEFIVSTSSSSPNRSRHGTVSPPVAGSSPIPAYAPFRIVSDASAYTSTASGWHAVGEPVVSNALGNNSGLCSLDPPDPHEVYIPPNDSYQHRPLSDARADPSMDRPPLNQLHTVLHVAQSQLHVSSWQPHSTVYPQPHLSSYSPTLNSLPLYPPPEIPTNFNLAYSSLHRFADTSARGVNTAPSSISHSPTLENSSRRASASTIPSQTPTPDPDVAMHRNADGGSTIGGRRSSEPDHASFAGKHPSSIPKSPRGVSLHRHPHRIISDRTPGSSPSTLLSPLLPLDLACVQAAGAAELGSTASYDHWVAAGLPMHAIPDGNEGGAYSEDLESDVRPELGL